jgi:hypothetical protein
VWLWLAVWQYPLDVATIPGLSIAYTVPDIRHYRNARRQCHTNRSGNRHTNRHTNRYS